MMIYYYFSMIILITILDYINYKYITNNDKSKYSTVDRLANLQFNRKNYIYNSDLNPFQSLCNDIEEDYLSKLEKQE